MLNFKEDGCEVYEGLLSKETLKLLHTYTFKNKLEFVVTDEHENDIIVPGPPTMDTYADTLMELLQTTILEKLEERTGLELVPTYTFYRTYVPGNSLEIHKDRPSCEISVTILLDAQYKPDKGYRWEIFVDPEGYRNGGTSSGIGAKQKPGDGLIYRGCDIPHWREEFLGEEGSYHTQLFCHFIDKNGPNYPKWKYDSRPGLGFHHSSKKYI